MTTTHADRRPSALSAGLTFLAILLAVMWGAEVVDTVVLGDRLQTNFGIIPRQTRGIDGVAFSPLLHASFTHLIANTIPFAILGGLIALRGVGRLISVTVIVAVVGGGLTWLLATSGNHIGASGVVFGYLGYLVGVAFFERRWRNVLAAIIAVVLYGGAIFGIVPQAGISWEGHLFGLLAGVLAARGLSREP